MRLVCTLKDQKYAQVFSDFLKREGIDNELEIAPNSDWGSPDYGIATCRVWAYDEEQFQSALEWTSLFLENPTDSKFYSNADQRSPIAPLPPLYPQEIQLPDLSDKPDVKLSSKKSLQPTLLTTYFLLGCVLFFILSIFTTPKYDKVPQGLPYIALFSSPIKKDMLYDWPYAYELVGKIEKILNSNHTNSLDELPEDGKVLLAQYNKIGYWHGIYPQLIEHFKDSNTPWNFSVPMFEKIKQGEIWRFFTPILFHSDIFHLLFNMIWLAVLGKQIEMRVNKYRYLFFILLLALFSNTAQYLMSGPNFLGFSGVLCGMLGFFWMRQRKAAWEGYTLQSGTMTFIWAFIMTMALLQIGSFFTESYLHTTISPGIANTAHLSGAFLGVLLGRLNFFSRQTKV